MHQLNNINSKIIAVRSVCNQYTNMNQDTVVKMVNLHSDVGKYILFVLLLTLTFLFYID